MEKRAGSVEKMVMNFWKNKKVFITGHTGFKGAWLCLWLSQLGAKVFGYALKPPTQPNLFELARVDELINGSTIADIRDLNKVKAALKLAKPEIVIHLAAQPIVRESYNVPVETFAINIMGTVNILEAVRFAPSVKSVVIITTDKVYENSSKGQGSSAKGFNESNPLGGYDPYSSSKAGAELVANAYYCSYFKNKISLATARAGNVIGGGDFASDRLVPDFVRSIIQHKPILVRNPKAVRPWQHVLEPLSGYMLLAQKQFNGAWNFGPNKKDIKTVGWLVKHLCKNWEKATGYTPHLNVGYQRCSLHEAHYLELDSSKAINELQWEPKWKLEQALEKVVEWTRAYLAREDMRKICIQQIREYSHG